MPRTQWGVGVQYWVFIPKSDLLPSSLPLQELLLKFRESTVIIINIRLLLLLQLDSLLPQLLPVLGNGLTVFLKLRPRQLVLPECKVRIRVGHQLWNEVGFPGRLTTFTRGWLHVE